MTKNNQKGFSLVELLVVVIIIGIIAAIAIPSLLASRRAANEAQAIGNLRTINSAQATYLGTLGGGTNYATIANLAAAANGNLLDAGWTASPVTRGGYKYTEQATPTTTWCVHAEPVGGAGTRSFGVGIDGVIYYNAAGTALTCTAGVVGGGTVLGN